MPIWLIITLTFVWVLFGVFTLDAIDNPNIKEFNFFGVLIFFYVLIYPVAMGSYLIWG